MVVTIIGSCSSVYVYDMNLCKDFFESIGFVVNCPCDKERNGMTIFEKQRDWLGKIKDSDLIVLIPKAMEKHMTEDRYFQFNIGESTSYELAIAKEFNKKVVIWEGV